MFIHLIRTNSNAVLYMAGKDPFVYMYHNFFLHSSVDGHLGCFHVLAVANSAAVNNGIHVSFSVFHSKSLFMCSDENNESDSSHVLCSNGDDFLSS